jgi:hypothetical protein
VTWSSTGRIKQETTARAGYILVNMILMANVKWLTSPNHCCRYPLLLISPLYHHIIEDVLEKSNPIIVIADVTYMPKMLNNLQNAQRHQCPSAFLVTLSYSITDILLELKRFSFRTLYTGS